MVADEADELPAPTAKEAGKSAPVEKPAVKKPPTPKPGAKKPPASDQPASKTPPAAAKLPPGFRQIHGQHLRLITDLGPSPEIDALPRAFDLAVPEWCRLLAVEPQKAAEWHLTGYLMKSRERFEQAGLVSSKLPPFKSGYSTGDELWLYDQTSDYYRRHLLLHEGTHCFINDFFGGSGPPWYAEGLAELYGTHHLEDGKLTLGYMPKSRADAPGWGRIKLVRDSCSEGRTLSLPAVMAYDSRAHLENEPYGWCWAAAAFLDGHPRYRERFAKLRSIVKRGDFVQQTVDLYKKDWGQLNEEWQVYIANLKYGYDFERMQIDFRPGKPLPQAGRDVEVAADRGWQSSGVVLEAGKTYRLTATGRYQVASDPKPWPCEPGGVTLRYYYGQPLGILLAAVRNDKARAGEISSLTKPIVIGRGGTLTPEVTGTLYLRINDSAGKLSDNSGNLTVVVNAEGE